MKPICYPCQRFYRPKKNGFAFIEGMPIGNDVPPGPTHDAQWEPYKLWMGDLWHCLGCGHELIVGTGYRPIAVQHDPKFAELVESYRATWKVNDC